MDSILLVSLFYANQKPVYEPEPEKQPMDFPYWTMVMSTASATGVSICFLVLFETSFMSFDSHRCSQLSLLLSILILTNALSLYYDESFTSFDPNWIHSVGG
ncbi:hypothetical protein V6N13_098048 [Hibiscus sabdariffa]|uniref:Uncharacterized protein n=1 Tax=Hibiscus sabdariffa TaxID=183260 RepID=A0ABR2NVJ7_9ROSI